MITRSKLVCAEGNSARYFITLALTAAVAATTVFNSQPAFGHGGDNHDEGLDTIPAGTSSLLPDDAKVPYLHGVIGPILPMHTMSVHNTICWKKDKKMPVMLMFHRHSAYTADEVANPDVIDFLIANPSPTTGLNCFGSSSNQLNSSFRRSFNQFAYGGYNIIHDVSQSVPTRISVDQTIELTQLWDMNHPQAFAYDFNSPPYSAAAITNADAQLNFAAFRNQGHSKGLFYDMYCPGFGTLTDGRAVFMGGHDMNSQNGNYRIQIFDPESESWAPRPESCMRKYFGKDAESSAFRVANGLQADDWNLEKYYRAKMDEFQAADPEHDLTATELRTLMQSVYLPGCDPHDLPDDVYSPTYAGIRLAGPNGTVTNPGKLTSDMKYARWYPTQVTLPTNQILIYAGWDRDESFYPQPTSISSTTTAMQPFLDNAANYPNIPPNAELSGFLKSGGDSNFLNSRVKQVVPEVYDAKTDTCIALENAPFFNNAWYPNGLVVQTGPGRNDWKVAVNDGDLLGNVASDNNVGAHKPANTVSNRDYHNTWLFDVQAALKSPDRDTPPADAITQTTSAYWKFLADAPSSHSEFTGNANIVELDKLGRVISHKLTHVGGQNRVSLGSSLASPAVAGDTTVTLAGPLEIKDYYTIQSETNIAAENVLVTGFNGNVATLSKPLARGHSAGRTFTRVSTSKFVEEIDFAPLSKKTRPGETPVAPTWQTKGELYQPGRQNYCTPLPDGTVMILGGNGGTLDGIERWSLHTQLYDPAKPYDPANPAMTNSVRKMAKSLIPRDEHGIIQLMPDATVYLGGQNRNGLVQAGDPIAPLGDSDLGVPCGQIFRPPYLFDGNANPAVRPMIAKAPAIIDYGRPFKVQVYSLKKIKMVSLIRTGSMSHSISPDTRMVKVAFKQTGGNLTVFAPKLPGTAVGGYYQLFILDEAGVPSESVKVQLGRDIVKRIGKPASPFALTASTP